jgi:hypothetical protein
MDKFLIMGKGKFQSVFYSQASAQQQQDGYDLECQAEQQKRDDPKPIDVLFLLWLL